MSAVLRDNDRRHGLPDFDSPPVTEVVLGVQFEPLPMLAPQIGLFWSEVRERFPQLQQHAALEPVVERFGVKLTTPVGGFKLMEQAETPRCWLLDASGNQLIQVQADRLLHNWRKIEDSDPYPRYEAIRTAFLSEWERFKAFVNREGWTLKPNQCEVTYIDNIRPSGVWENFGHADRIFRVWATPAAGGFLPDLEDARFAVRYVIPDDKGAPLGRLHVSVQPAYLKRDGSEVFAMNLTARGAPEGDGPDGVIRFLDRGHRWIVLGFDALTTEAMHRAWGKHGK